VHEGPFDDAFGLLWMGAESRRLMRYLLHCILLAGVLLLGAGADAPVCSAQDQEAERTVRTAGEIGNLFDTIDASQPLRSLQARPRGRPVTLQWAAEAVEGGTFVVERSAKDTGYHEHAFDGTDLPSGTYFVRPETPGGQQSHRMVLLK
jgi:hypothetical protein